MNSFRVLSSGCSGANTYAMSLVLEVGWLTRPKKEQKSVRLLGVGNCAMALVMSVLMEYPSGVSMNPAKCAFSWQNWMIERYLFLFTPMQDLSDVLYVFFRITIEKDNIINNLEDIIGASECLIIIVLTDWWNPIWSPQVLEMTERSDKGHQLMALFIKRTLVIAF